MSLDELRKFIGESFEVVDDHTLTREDEDRPAQEGGGPRGRYVTFEFNTLQYPMGDGDFRITFFQKDDEPWKVVDYEAIPERR